VATFGFDHIYEVCNVSLVKKKVLDFVSWVVFNCLMACFQIMLHVWAARVGNGLRPDMWIEESFRFRTAL